MPEESSHRLKPTVCTLSVFEHCKIGRFCLAASLSGVVPLVSSSRWMLHDFALRDVMVSDVCLTTSVDYVHCSCLVAGLGLHLSSSVALSKVFFLIACQCLWFSGHMPHDSCSFTASSIADRACIESWLVSVCSLFEIGRAHV